MAVCSTVPKPPSLLNVAQPLRAINASAAKASGVRERVEEVVFIVSASLHFVAGMATRGRLRSGSGLRSTGC